MRTPLLSLLAAVLLLALLVLSAPVMAAKSTSCYATVLKAAPPPVKAINLVLVDGTAPGVPAAAVGYRKIVQEAAARPMERTILIPFAGLSSKEVPRPVLDVSTEPLLTEQQEEKITLATGRRMRACIAKVKAHNMMEVDRVVQRVIQQPQNPVGEFSEISYALRTVIADFARQGVPLRAFVFSDGAEYSRSGQNFYAKGAPRLIDPAREVAVLEKKGWASLPADRKPNSLSVIWFGLGAVPTASKYYLSPAQLEAFQMFWGTVLRGYGADRVQISMVLANPTIE